MPLKRRYYKVILSIAFSVLIISGCATQAPYFKLAPSLERDVRTFGSVEYIPLEELCESYKISYKWDKFINKATLQKGGKKIALRAGSDIILVDGYEKKIESPVLISEGAAWVPVSFVRNNLSDVVGTAYYPKAPEPRASGKFVIKTIVIDAGHGGKDAGATGRRFRLKEKNLTLAIARKLKDLLEREALNVVMTRSDDRFISLSKRAEIANRSGADLFVSIHVNASRTRTLKGFECYYLSDATDDNARALEAMENAHLKIENGTVSEHSNRLDATLWDMALTENRRESACLARTICDSVEDTALIGNRGIRSARFYVLKYTRTPGVLVEMGYLSNRYEEAKLKSQAFLDKMTASVARGILAYKKEYEKTDGFTSL